MDNKSRARKKILDAAQRKTDRTLQQEVASTKKAFDIDRARKFLKENFEFRYNVMSNEIEIRYKRFKKKKFKKFDDYTFNSINIELDLKGIHIPENKLRQLLVSIYISDKYDPIKDYLFNLEKWDGETDHIKKFFDQLYLKNQDDYEYLLNCFRKWYVGMVMAYVEDEPEPFNVNQVALILLSSHQGKYKSTWLGSIVPKDLRLKLYYPNSFNIHNKDHLKYLATKMLINLDEMESYNKTDIGTMKSVITISQVALRLPYGKTDIEVKRRCSFCGSLNIADFLRDETGSRRFIIIEIDGIAYDKNYNVDNMYAQALELHRQGFQYWFDGKEIAEIEKRNESYSQGSMEEEYLLQAFTKPSPDDDESTYRIMTTSQICDSLSNDHPRWNINNSVRNLVGRALRKHNFERVPFRPDGNPSSRYGWKVKPLFIDPQQNLNTNGNS